MADRGKTGWLFVSRTKPIIQNTGLMSHKDFAMSLVASGNVSDIGKYLERVASMPPQTGKV